MRHRHTAGVLVLCLGLGLGSCKTALTDKTEYENGWEFEHPEGNRKGKNKKDAPAPKTAEKPPDRPAPKNPAAGNATLKKEVDQWLGVPYKYGGTTKQGVDCSGFCANVFRTVYHISLGRSAQDIYEQSKPVNRAAVREGDLVFFKINSQRVSHVGIYLSENKFVHASTSRGVMISDLGEAYWTKYYFGFGRVSP